MVAILLSTYNGAKYLQEQIDSIISQSYTDWNLYIRDDGSTDNTVDVIEKYATNHSNIHLVKDAEHRGACGSFLWLLNQVSADFYMFCDQDDVWLLNKIEISILEMQNNIHKYGFNTPILVHTDLIVVDEQLNQISSSFWKYAKLKQRYLSKFNYLGVCNGVTGCTMMINNRAKEIVFPIHKDAPMHDYWIALKVAQSGKILTLNTPTIHYRQHSMNEVGAKAAGFLYFFKKVKYLKKTIKKQLKNYYLLRDLFYGSIFKYYWYKLIYSIIRNL